MNQIRPFNPSVSIVFAESLAILRRLETDLSLASAMPVDMARETLQRCAREWEVWAPQRKQFLEYAYDATVDQVSQGIIELVATCPQAPIGELYTDEALRAVMEMHPSKIAVEISFISLKRGRLSP